MDSIMVIIIIKMLSPKRNCRIIQTIMANKTQTTPWL